MRAGSKGTISSVFPMYFPRCAFYFLGEKARAEGRGGHNEPLADSGWDLECVYRHDLNRWHACNEETKKKKTASHRCLGPDTSSASSGCSHGRPCY